MSDGYFKTWIINTIQQYSLYTLNIDFDVGSRRIYKNSNNFLRQYYKMKTNLFLNFPTTDITL